MPPMPPMPPAPTPPAPGPVPLEQSKADMLEALPAKFAGLEIAMPIMAKSAAPGTKGAGVMIQTNVFGLELQKDSILYSYSVNMKADLTPTKDVVFTKKGKDDFIVLDRHEKCIAIMDTLKNTDDFLKINSSNVVYYDGQSQLFSVQDLFPGQTKKSTILEVSGAATKCPELIGLEKIFIEISESRTTLDGRKTDGTIRLTQENLLTKTADPNLKVNDRSLTQFLEIALNQYCLMNPNQHACFEHGKVYLTEPWKASFDKRDCPEVGDGKRLGVGTKKSVYFIEGPDGRNNNNPSLVVDAMKAAFHEPMNCAMKIFNILNREADRLEAREIEKCEQVIRGLDVFTEHTKKKRHLKIEALSQSTAASASFEVEGKGKVLLVDYFQQTYNINLRFPYLPLLICKVRGNSNFYPLELCTISPMQRVTIPQTTALQQSKTTKECAVPPLKRQENIMKALQPTEILNPENPFTKALGIKVYPNPLMVHGRKLDGVNLVYGNSASLAQNGKWRPAQQYAHGTNINCWAIYCVTDNQRDFSVTQLKFFAKKFYDECKRHGMNMQEPSQIDVIASNQVQSYMEGAAAHNCQFIFFITSDSITSLHDNIKLYERQLQVVTQDMKLSVALKVVNEDKRLTLTNIVNKTNIKMGGQNYGINNELVTDDQLVIGISLSHPPPAAQFQANKGVAVPTIIGFASNGVGRDAFVGDFILHPMRREETVTVMGDVIKSTVAAFKKSRGGNPKRVILYRSGVAEGSYALILSHEIPLIKMTLKTLGMENIGVVFIVVSKDHNVRLFNERIDGRSSVPEQNIPSGIVVDSEITHPSHKEFYLNSHTTLQGSAKTPRYTVLYDDLNVSLDRLEGLTYALAHDHQIVTLATSVPTPLYVAANYAKRGRALYTAKCQSDVSNSNDSEPTDLSKLTAELGFKGTKFEGKRVNA